MENIDQEGFIMVSKNLELWEEAIKIMLGAQSNLRAAVMSRPTFILKGKGTHLWDVEGREYVDLTGGFSRILLDTLE